MPSVNANESYQLLSTYGIYDRDVARELGLKFPRSGALSWMMASNMQGRIRKQKQNRHLFSFWEEQQHLNTIVTIAAADIGTPNQVTITLSTGDHQDSGARSYPIVTQTAVFEDETVGLVTAVNKASANAHTVTILRVNTSQDVQAAAVVGSKVSFFSNAQKEASTAPEGHIDKQTKINNYLQTFRKKYQFTDHSAQNVTEFEYKGQKYLHVIGSDNTADRFAFEEEVGLLITPLSESLVDAGSNTIQTTNGLIPQIDSDGVTMEYFDTPDMSDFDDAITLLINNYGERDYVVGRGTKLALKMKNWLVDFQKETPNVFFEEMGSMEQAIKLNFTTVKINNFTFHFNEWDLFDHPDSLGDSNFKYGGMAVFIPTGKTRDPMSGNSEPYIKLAFAEPGGSASEKMANSVKFWETGANARGGATDETLHTVLHWASYKGLEVRCRNRFMIWRESA